MSKKKYCCEDFKDAFEGYVNEAEEQEIPLIIKVKAKPGMTWYEINDWAIGYCPFCGSKLKEEK